MFAQSRRAYGFYSGSNRDDDPARNIGHINCNDCGEKGHYSGIRYSSVQVQLRKDAEAYRDTSKYSRLNKKSTNEA